MRRIRIAALLLCLLLLAGCSAVPDVKIKPDGTADCNFVHSSAPVEAAEVAGYIPAASNDRLSLYYEPTGLTVAVRDNLTGNVVYSSATPDEESSAMWKNFVNSGIAVDYYKGKATVIERVNLYSGKPKTNIYLVKDGFAADINFPTVGISLSVCVTLKDNGIEVLIPNSSIKETNDNFKLAAIWAFPFLGNTHLGDTPGYMLIPDGCGALISLKDNHGKFKQPYKSAVYGYDYSVVENTAVYQEFEEEIATVSDSASVFAPVFGMVHTDKKEGILGIVESGNCNAEIYAYPNGVITDYNWITARYLFRQVYLYPTSQTSGINSYETKRATYDIKTKYIFVSGDEADYVGLAKAYRRYLTEKGVLKATEKDYEMRLDFFAGDVEKAVIGNRFVAMTTVSQMDEILSELAQKGVKNSAVTYKGWQKGGIFDRIKSPSGFQKQLGSYAEFSALNRKYKTAEWMLYADVLNTYTKNGNFMYRYNGKIFSDETHLTLHPDKYRLLPQNSFELLDAFADDGALPVVDGITNELYSYSVNDKTATYTRQRSAGDTAKKLAGIKSGAYIKPNDYLWNSTERYYDFELYGSDYKFSDREVPFFAIVLKGSIPLYSEYVNFKADSKEYLLRMIESGVYPSFLLTYQSPNELLYTDSANLYTTYFGEYKDVIVSDYKIFSKLHRMTSGAVIDGFTCENNVSTVTYSNGAKVYVNYNAGDVTVDGKPVPGMGYYLEAGDSK